MTHVRFAVNAGRGANEPSPRPDLFVGSLRRLMAVVVLTVLLVFLALYQASAATPADLLF
ncbi:hypothetical protein BH23CHL2_BH23CHL2_26150 [soil metagenome]